MFDLTSIQDILRKERSKIIIIEDGRPSYILLPVEAYRALIGRQDLGDSHPDYDVPSVVEEKTLPADTGERISTSSLGTSYLGEQYKFHSIKLEDLPF